MNNVVIVVTHNRVNLLKKCVTSILNQTKKFERVIIINNGSTDGTAEYLTSIVDIDVINSDNTGSAGGFYLGLTEALKFGFDYYYLFDDDCELYSNFHEKSLEYISDFNTSRGETFSVFSPKILETGRQTKFVGVKNGKWLSDEIDSDIKFYKTDDLGFPFMILSNKTLNKAGLPLSFWFTTYDDTEWVYRMKLLGINLYILNFDGGIHYVQRKLFYLLGKPFEWYPVWKTFYFFRNSIIFRKMFGKRLGMLRVVYLMFLTLLFPDHRIKRFYNAFKGLCIGLKFKV